MSTEGMLATSILFSPLPFFLLLLLLLFSSIYILVNAFTSFSYRLRSIEGNVQTSHID